MMGSLLFVTRNTRPDILNAVNYLSRFQSEPTPEIVGYAKRIMRYLRGTLDAGFLFKSNGQRSITSFVDASFASAQDDQFQSTTGFQIYSYGDLVDWGVCKQACSMTSTASAEYVAMNDAVKNIEFLRKMNSEILLVKELAVLYKVSTSAISIARGTESTEGRFLLTKYFAIKQAVDAKEVEIKSIPGSYQPADLLTKATDVTTFRRLRPFIVNIGSEEYIQPERHSDLIM